jgi:hypothetical protein
MEIDARFLIYVSQLAIKFGERVIVPNIDLCYPEKPLVEKGAINKMILDMIHRGVDYNPMTNKISRRPHAHPL